MNHEISRSAVAALEAAETSALREYWAAVIGGEYPGDGVALDRIMQHHFRLIDQQVLGAELAKDIVRAHDIIREALHNPEVGWLLPELPSGLRPMYDTLCWVLGHKRNKGFQSRLELTEAALAAVGAEIVDRRCAYGDDE